ncbi:putative RNA helicase SDE3 isoform X1 [Bidens hawaiensis]|uniref:putative RNA helicase SDE3 isoform X1 n=1 Tax=Bidens hawaiensis TaxID=980011 RepID=UPI004049DD7E
MGSVNSEEEETRSVIDDVGNIGNVDFANNAATYTYNPEAEGPIVISVPFPLTDGKPHFVALGETVSNPITIENTTSQVFKLWSIEIYDSKPKDSFTLSLMKPPSPDSDQAYIKSFVESFTMDDRTLYPATTLTVWLSCKALVKGLHTTAVHFNFDDDQIERMGFIMVEDKISRSLTSNKPYNRPMRNNKPMIPKIYSSDKGIKVIRGYRPAKNNSRAYKRKLPEYRIPVAIRKVIESKATPDALIEGLNMKNYYNFFRTLLIMEEIKLEDDMRTYDMQNVTFKRKGRFLTLEVPGLSERRPSIVTGDIIVAKLVQHNEHTTAPLYKGYIFRVEAEEILISFHEDVHSYHAEGDHYDVQFEYNRLGMRRLYQASEACGKLDPEFLFPEFSSNERHIETRPLVPFSCNLNEEQLSSVEMILGCKGGPPYIIHGPPGTGKSVTLTEAILQLYTTQRNSIILVCAPSNSAADHLLARLVLENAVKIRKQDILRLNAPARSIDDIKSEFLEFCSFDEDTTAFNCPMYEHLIKYRIIVSTYASAALIYAEAIKKGHFTHIFLDEAAQASEPETMIPISHFYRRDTVVVLAGDPVQLGPVIFSKDAEGYGLGKSFMERLCESKFYKHGDQNYVTKLVRNYRCHEHILSLPSTLFYKGDLVPCKEDDTLYPLTWKDYIPNPEFPVLFLGVQGVDEREGNNPSWFNRIEASEVVEVILNLKDKGIKNEDIGVITPYRQQVIKISTALETFVGSEIKVGTVEAFQGQEREVIIVSTVRSTIKHNDTDKRHCLGFLSNPRRFNVAITRARSLLIAIGNPHIICKDEHWNKLLWHCVENDSYKGCFLPKKEEIVEEACYGGEQASDGYLPEGTYNCKWIGGEGNWGGGNEGEEGNWGGDNEGGEGNWSGGNEGGEGNWNGGNEGGGAGLSWNGGNDGGGGCYNWEPNTDDNDWDASEGSAMT